jgi:cobalt-zinc-cadmium efflux system protein
LTHCDARPQLSKAADVRALGAALVLGVVILALEVGGGLWAGSLALLSDAGHMLTDVFALFLALLSVHFARRPATAAKTYGYHRLEILCALFNGVILCVIALAILYEAVRRLREPPPVAAGIMLVVGIVGLAGNLAAAWLLHRGRHNAAVRGAYLHVLGDTMSSFGVVAGALAMRSRQGLQLVDPLLSLAIAVVILWSAIRLVRDTTDVLLESSPKGIEALEVVRAMEAVGGVMGVHDLHIWSLTAGYEALSAHVTVERPALATPDQVLMELKRLLAERFAIHHTTLQLESDAYEHIGVVHD